MYSQIEIEAPPHRVWDTLVDFDAYADWNPFIRKIGGAARPGGRLTVEIHPRGGRPMTFRPIVLRAQPHRELRWRGRLLLPGLFDGEHIFSIAPLSSTRVRFSQREKFSGLLVPLGRRMLLDATLRGFEEMNQALERRCALTGAGVGRI
ncbi:MAG: polyketide cyclase [Acidobacteria bacterium 13_1_40CM_2_68_5]|nr:MAG: polyketide cyclase [Acidobacteria bacterium 13_1_40CM_2_68_5]